MGIFDEAKDPLPPHSQPVDTGRDFVSERIRGAPTTSRSRRPSSPSRQAVQFANDTDRAGADS